MEQFDELMVRYDGLIRKVLAHMRIYENFEEFYHIATIELWLATTTYCADKSNFEKYAFLNMKYAISKELTHRTKGLDLLYMEESSILEQATSDQQDFVGAWFDGLCVEEQQLLRWVFVQGYTNGDVARHLRISEEAVKKRRQRLLKKLKNDPHFCLKY
ncbi:MAG: sigma-70 family RNA polymerase sigma factor [Solibacillus sp.]